MRHYIASLFVMALVSSSACTREATLPVSPTVIPVTVTGTFTVTPGNVSLGNSVTVSWSLGSAVRVDACSSQGCIAIATSGNSVSHTPTSRGSWTYVLYSIVASPDVVVRVGDPQTVIVQ